MARTFQNIRIFRAMTVEENVMVAGHHLHTANILDAMLRSRRYDRDEQALSKRARELLDILGLAELADEPAGSLPYGSQRRLEIARALMLSPALLARRTSGGHEQPRGSDPERANLVLARRAGTGLSCWSSTTWLWS